MLKNHSFSMRKAFITNNLVHVKANQYSRISNLKWWFDDKGFDAEFNYYVIPMDILQQLRNESADSSFVFRDNLNCLELRTRCDFGMNDDSTSSNLL